MITSSEPFSLFCDEPFRTFLEVDADPLNSIASKLHVAWAVNYVYVVRTPETTSEVSEAFSDIL
jgi:hypothetical protein